MYGSIIFHLSHLISKEYQTHTKKYYVLAMINTSTWLKRLEKWTLVFDTGCWLLRSGISSGGSTNTSARYGVAKLLTNDQISRQLEGERL